MRFRAQIIRYWSLAMPVSAFAVQVGGMGMKREQGGGHGAGVGVSGFPVQYVLVLTAGAPGARVRAAVPDG